MNILQTMDAAAPFTFHHLGLAARSREKAALFLRTLGYSVGAQVDDDIQQVCLSYCTHPTMPAVEIITPDGRPGGPLDNMLRDKDALFYHTCYAVQDTDAAVNALRTTGNRLLCLSAKKPAVLFGGASVSFWQVAGFGTVELLEEGC